MEQLERAKDTVNKVPIATVVEEEPIEEVSPSENIILTDTLNNIVYTNANTNGCVKDSSIVTLHMNDMSMAERSSESKVSQHSMKPEVDSDKMLIEEIEDTENMRGNFHDKESIINEPDLEFQEAPHCPVRVRNRYREKEREYLVKRLAESRPRVRMKKTRAHLELNPKLNEKLLMKPTTRLKNSNRYLSCPQP